MHGTAASAVQQFLTAHSKPLRRASS